MVCFAWQSLHPRKRLRCPYNYSAAGEVTIFPMVSRHILRTHVAIQASRKASCALFPGLNPHCSAAAALFCCCLCCCLTLLLTLTTSNRCLSGRHAFSSSISRSPPFSEQPRSSFLQQRSSLTASLISQSGHAEHHAAEELPTIEIQSLTESCIVSYNPVATILGLWSSLNEKHGTDEDQNQMFCVSGC